ncbi:GGDEF domain-containing protein [Vibrio tubiashii]|uniref:GGDEF domain-containing protein n=1 Tax=Vibrio tubiashii TaxID=29498 RepID=UPI001EFD784D|nr:GGDEF domain-containing protein [Vibrio tubiashii]MCG9582275.1 GGDEF domain-containing protein [Vibrio tubiashii]MCG9615866.1 GGDEF domain-containing protein [Vibrio tubiashii]MCG9689034.1 GGDEF domain-containing protein [Vibrio tubiashii]
MVVVTILVVQLYWMHGGGHVFKIFPGQFVFLPTDDQALGGVSTASLESSESEVVLNCQLDKSDAYSWPYCGVAIQLGETMQHGINLKNYHTVRLNIDFEQLDSTAEPTLRFYLRNFNPAYSSAEDEYTQKYNGLAYSPGVGGGVVDIPIANLQVLTWWLADNEIPIAHSAPEFTNVTKLELATGSGHFTGEYKMTIKSIEFIGNYIEGETLMLALLVFWVSLALVYSIVEIKRSHQLILKSQFRQDHLRKLNSDLKEQNIHFAELANRDALTGAMNRHSIREWLEQHFEGKLGCEKALAALYLDIDHFKDVNDKYGHAMGDDILREFTMVILSMLSPSERLVRWGGEEFVVFCPGLSLDEASDLAERIRHRVESHIWVHGDPLTTSIGVASRSGERTNAMITRADEALYMAKRQGRNQVVVSSQAD